MTDFTGVVSSYLSYDYDSSAYTKAGEAFIDIEGIHLTDHLVHALTILRHTVTTLPASVLWSLLLCWL